jgi:hypothetical protein
LIAAVLAGCASPPATASASATAAPTTTPTARASATVAASRLVAYSFPAHIDPAGRYLFYLHGRIIEDHGLQAVDPRFGAYEYAAILERLGSSGLTVISEPRERNADPPSYARRIQDQVETLKRAGVASEHITVVGASKGAYIAALSSFIMQDAALNFVLLGSCHPEMIGEWKSSTRVLYGNVLAIHDVADEEYAGSCQELFQLSEGRGLGRHEQLVLDVGTGHAILYQPLEEWIVPTLEWASR